VGRGVGDRLGLLVGMAEGRLVGTDKTFITKTSKSRKLFENGSTLIIVSSFFICL
jgi:hypothetical protein